MVETFSGVPESRTNEYARNREEFFSTFLKERAQSARVDGIYLLVMKEAPPHRFRVQAGVGQATRQRAFTVSDRDELVRLVQSSFREDNYDEALRGGVAFVERRMRGNLSAAPVGRPVGQGNPSRPLAPAGGSSSSSPLWSFLVLGMFVVGGVLIVGFLLRLIRGGSGGGGGFGGASGLAGGGGGFFSSLLGGIGGAMAGSWLYDRFLGGNAHAADSLPSNHPDAPGSDVGGDFSSSGGDVDSGGGGGGDLGGGGDFGGGGGDSGGGGDA